MEIPIKNTIFLQGVFFSKVKTLEEHMIQQPPLDTEIGHDQLSNHKFNDIRITKFKNKKQWIEAYKDSTIKCWYCGLAFKNIPIFIPRQIRNTSVGKEYDTHGLFCGFACAFSFLKTQAEFIKNKSFSDKLSMLKMLFLQIHNKKVVEFKEAPCVYDLTLYGGHIDITEYKNNLRQINDQMVKDAKYVANSK